MKRWYSVLIVLAIIGVAIWIFMIIAGDGPSSEELQVGDPRAIKTQTVDSAPKNTSNEKANETNKSEKKELEKKLNIIDLGLNLSSELVNYPTSTEFGSTRNTTLIKLMYLEWGLWEVFTRNIYADSMPAFLQEHVFKTIEPGPIRYTPRLTFLTNMTLHNFSDSNFRNNNYTIGFNLTAKEDLLAYRLDLTQSVPLANLSKETIAMLGNEYYVWSADDEIYELRLLEAPYRFALTTEESFLINYPGQDSLLISINELENPYAYLDIDNITTEPLQAEEMYQYKNMNIFVEEILSTKDGKGKVILVLSPQELILENGKAVQKNSSIFEDITFEFYPDDSATIDGFTITWTPRKKSYVAFNNSITFPLFENIEIAMSDWAYQDIEFDDDPYVYVYITTKTSELLRLNDTFTGI